MKKLALLLTLALALTLAAPALADTVTITCDYYDLPAARSDAQAQMNNGHDVIFNYNDRGADSFALITIPASRSFTLTCSTGQLGLNNMEINGTFILNSSTYLRGSYSGSGTLILNAGLYNQGTIKVATIINPERIDNYGTIAAPDGSPLASITLDPNGGNLPASLRGGSSAITIRSSVAPAAFTPTLAGATFLGWADANAPDTPVTAFADGKTYLALWDIPVNPNNPADPNNPANPNNPIGPINPADPATPTTPNAINTPAGRFNPLDDPASGSETLPVIGCKEWANVRSAPSTDAEIVGQVSLGEVVTLLEWNPSGTWCKILFANNTKSGWLHHRFLLR